MRRRDLLAAIENLRESFKEHAKLVPHLVVTVALWAGPLWAPIFL